ncbi:hypothetical protein GCK72_004364 [Caenorhabditis remanei]|uniref:Uncharacterized protein n=1 Tax=Caenorhabditis remanei TaxID=31234 RepID=A0A6A5HC54_CAERE|nr:hypothetical protein GCK72_004364 [Caenorhabditis remanei]KAF1764416.1 hypothetical protein GCK72_004364 [Caenorhabditis remanei]
MSVYFGQVVRNSVMSFYDYLMTSLTLFTPVIESNVQPRRSRKIRTRPTVSKMVTDAVLSPEDLLKLAVKKLRVLKKEGGSWRQEALQNVLVLKLYNHIEESNKELKTKKEVLEESSSSV